MRVGPDRTHRDLVRRVRRIANEIDRDPEEYMRSGAILDIEYTHSGNRSLSNIVLIISTGGPHIEVDLGRCVVAGYWAGDSVEEPISTDACDRLWEYWAEVGGYS